MKNIVKIILSLILAFGLIFACMALFALGVTIDDIYDYFATEGKSGEINGIYEVNKYEPTENIEKLIPPEWD